MLTDKQAALFIAFAIGKRMREVELEGDEARIEVLKDMLRQITRDNTASNKEPEPDLDVPSHVPRTLLN